MRQPSSSISQRPSELVSSRTVSPPCPIATHRPARNHLVLPASSIHPHLQPVDNNQTDQYILNRPEPLFLPPPTHRPPRSNPRTAAAKPGSKNPPLPSRHHGLYRLGARLYRTFGRPRQVAYRTIASSGSRARGRPVVWLAGAHALDGRFGVSVADGRPIGSSSLRRAV